MSSSEIIQSMTYMYAAQMRSLCPLDKVENDAQCHSAAEPEKRQGILRTRCLRNIGSMSQFLICFSALENRIHDYVGS